MPLKARFKGTCNCGCDVDPGELIQYDRASRQITGCPSCFAALATGDDDNGRPEARRIRVKVQRVVFENPDGSFSVARVRYDGDIPKDSPVCRDRDFSVVGPLGVVVAGDLIEASGHWNDGKYGWEFKAIAAVPIVGATRQALHAYLSRFSQVGPRRAELILQHFGTRENVLKILEKEPEKLAEIPGLTAERAKEIGAEYLKDTELREVAMWLAELDLGETLTANILREWGVEAAVIIKDDPYELMSLPGIGFQRADSLAREKFGVAVDDPRRAAAAVLYLLDEEEHGFGGGHTWTALAPFLGE